MRSLLATFAAAGALCHGTAHALQIVDAHSFSTISNIAFIGITPFDPALGTLNSVQVSIDGVLTVNGITAQNLGSNGQTAVPVPYAFQVGVTHQFDGLGGKYFDFDTPASFTLSGAATGAGEGFALATNFSYDFSFTATTDLLGFAVPSVGTSFGALIPPISVSGLRADFLKSMYPLNEVDLVQGFSALGGGGPAPFVTDVHSGGALFVTYDYTPADPAPIPAPASLPLIAAGLLALGATRATARRAGRARV